MVRNAYTLHSEDDDFGQPGTLVREVMSDGDREGLLANIVGHASAPEVQDEMKGRVVEYWTNVDTDLGAKVADGLGVSATSPSGAAANGRAGNGAGSPQSVAAADQTA